MPLPMLKLLSSFKSRLAKESISIGLDIGSAAVKCVRLRGTGAKRELLDFNIEAVSDSPQAAIQKIICGLPALKSLNLAISGPASVIRCISLPRMSQEELRQSLKFEAQKHIPFSLAEVYLDSYILKSDLPDNRMLVLLVAAKKEAVERRLKLLDGLNLRLRVLDTDSLALVNAFNFNYPLIEEAGLQNKAIALLNIGSSVSNLNILHQGLLCLSRDINIAGNAFTQRIAELLGLEFKAAEEIKLTPDKEHIEKLAAAAETVMNSLIAELRASFDYYETQGSPSVVKIYLSGGGSLFTGVKDLLANLLGIETQYWDPFKNINVVMQAKAKLISSQLAVAIGLALRAN
jgi:type IV pilus assembly protein PilM